EAGIQEVNLQVSLRDGDALQSVPSVRWTPSQGWAADDHGRPVPISYVTFNLDGAGGPSGDLTQLQFDIKTKILSTPRALQDLLVLDQVTDVFEGDGSLAPPLALVQPVHVDTSYLTWNQRDPTSRLKKVVVVLSSDGRTYRAELEPKSVAGQLPSAPAFYWL